jgi:hypothetical protein
MIQITKHTDREERHPVVDNLLAMTGIDLTNGGGIPELIKFLEYFKQYRIMVFVGLNCKDLVFDGQVESEKRINLIYDDVTHHYHVINSMTGALARRFVCKGCNKGCKCADMHRFQETCSNCMSVPPCPYDDVRVPCESCNSLGVVHVLTITRRIRQEKNRL